MVSFAELWALLAAAARQLRWGLRATSGEMRMWRARAQAAPDQPLRDALLQVLHTRRSNVDGAALYCTLADRRSPRLLRLLTSYELVLDCLDRVNEGVQDADGRDGRRLHTALVDALDPGASCEDYFEHHPWHDDGGCIEALVHASRESCTSLPSWSSVRPIALGCAQRTQILALNHVSAGARESTLLGWLRGQAPRARDMTWFELGAAVSGEMLAIHPLLVLASKPGTRRAHVQSTHSAYFPWTSLAATMLDSYVDQFEDAERGCHSYVSHYRCERLTCSRLARVVEHALADARSLPRGRRHAVLVACMVAMYLTKDSARMPQLRGGASTIIASGGPLVKLLVPVLRLWRAAYDQRSA